MFCKNCGNKLDDDALFCMNCGVKITDDTSSKYCAHCGNALDADALFCMNCGNRIKEEQPQTEDSGVRDSQIKTTENTDSVEGNAEENLRDEKPVIDVQTDDNSQKKAELKRASENDVPHGSNSTQETKKKGNTGYRLLVAVIFITLAIFGGISIYKNYKAEKIKQALQQELMEIPMVRVEGGTYTMGDGFHSDIPKKTVSVSSFYIATTELTQKQWKIIMGDEYNPSFFKGDNYPVDSVNWVQAIMFCNWLSEYYGRTPCYTINGDFDIGKGLENQELTATSIYCNFSANGYRLPTEAEWEYAAREGNLNSKYRCSGSDKVNDVCWYFDNSKKTTHPVASKAPNALGIYDMSGNVGEWCWDGHIFKGNNSLLKRVRGGSYDDYLIWSSSFYVDCRNGEGAEPYHEYNGRGFRLVRSE